MVVIMPRPKHLSDDVFVRMPSGTKDLMEKLSGASPTPSAWVRQVLMNALRQEAKALGIADPFPKEED